MRHWHRLALFMLAAIAAVCLGIQHVNPLFAQSSPGLIHGQVPSAAQWNSYFAAKQDVLGYTALNKAGDSMLGKLSSVAGTPVLTSCGTSPAIAGNDQAGEVTLGTGTPTGCTITFSGTYPSAPTCVVSWQANLASMGYTISATALTLTQTATDSTKVNYFCIRATGQ